jgi:hypothetical protein
MATFLTNPRMNPALAARIRASLRQNRPRAGHVNVRWTAVLRLAALIAIVVGWVSLSVFRRHENDRLEGARRSLVDAVSAKRAELSADDMGTRDRAVAALQRATGPYEGDHIATEARSPEALSALLARPVLYVRAPIDGFANEDAILRAAVLSAPDAFVRCLVEPPTARTEKALLAAIRGDPEHPRAEVHVHRLYDLLAGLPLLQPRFKARAQDATKLRDLSRMQDEVRVAKLDQTIAAARARLLLFVMDEPSAPGGPTELDGERPHDVRVTLFDLTQRSPLLRMRRRVDPSVFSDRGRATRAASLDACALSFDVREAAAKVARAD